MDKKQDWEQYHSLAAVKHNFEDEASWFLELMEDDEIKALAEKPDKTDADVIDLVRRCNIRYVQFWFTDVLGELHSLSVHHKQIQRVFEEDGLGFDGSSVEGFARIEESDLLARPDPTTFALLPYRSASHERARIFCNLLEPSGADSEPYIGDPRRVLKEAVRRASEMGYDYRVGPELEFFYFSNHRRPEPVDHGGYFSMVPSRDVAMGIRRYTAQVLEHMGIEVEYTHHESAPSQHEVDLIYGDALTMADNALTYKSVVKEVALRFGLFASFMPKPITDCNGSGMHVHQSLWDKETNKNVFHDNVDQYGLSDVGKYFLAGLLRHAKEIAIVTNQWANSYKRLVPGYEAPCYICWGQRNRSTLVRVPSYKRDKIDAARVELRSPDAACHPHLAFAVMLGAGLKGIKNEYDLPKPEERDVGLMSAKEAKDNNLEVLPGTLGEAIDAAQDSDLLLDVLGDHIHKKLIENKRIEWEEYRKHVTDHDIERYYPLL